MSLLIYRLSRAFREQFFSRNIEEIQIDSKLRIYGASLAFTHLLSCYFWVMDRSLVDILTNNISAICWPFFTSCYAFRLPSAEFVYPILLIYIFSSVASVYFFLISRKLAGRGYWFLLFVTFFKLLLFVQDYRLRMNQHYMVLFVSLSFLFIPKKLFSIKWLIVLFYFWAGTLKLNQEWLSGAGIYRIDRLWIPKSLHVLSFYYVILLEMIFSFGLLLKKRSWFWFVFLQFLLFHLFSWPIVEYFYPLVMFLILSIFVVDRFFSHEVGISPQKKMPAIMFLGFFSTLQMVPYLFPGDVTLTGEGRYFSLNMFDAKSQCNPRLSLYKHDGRIVLIEPKLDSENQKMLLQPGRPLPVRIQCDPLVYYSWAKAACREKDVKEVDLYLSSKRASDQKFKVMVDIKNFCQKKIGYNMLWHNHWISTD